jgi:hypothetical protein
MANEKNIIKLEKEIRVKMMSIKSGKVLPKDSGIGKLINLMKAIDEPLYDSIMIEYKKVLSDIKK